MNRALSARWGEGLAAFGLALTIPDPFVAELLAAQQCDFVLVDMEHAPLTMDHVQNMVMALRGADASVLVRVPSTDAGTIGQALDVGAQGVVVPDITSAADARDAVAAAFYPPRGCRGVGPRRAGRLPERSPYLGRANDEVCVILMIESPSGVSHVDEIVRVEGVSGILVGAADLAATMGHLGEPAHHDVVAAVRRIGRACVDAGVPYGMHASTPEKAKGLLEQGARIVTVGSDVMLLENGASRALDAMAPLRNLAVTAAAAPEPR
jgi:4-hydroxy-2-oxoheptanedioate aldolase